MIPSKYQQAIFDYIRDSNGHLVVKATAGAGKSSTALESLRYVHPSKRILFLAYNKSIASALQARVPPTVKASTIHAQGWSICKQLYPNNITESDKVYNIIQEVSKSSHWIVPKDERSAFFGRINKIVNLMRLTLTSGEQACEDICDHFDIEDWDDEVTYALEAYHNVINSNKQIDFTDMIFIPATHDFKVKGYDLIYVDEFQDCCRAQYHFIKKLLNKNGRLILIGDPNQCIYSHSGADPLLFDEALAEPNTISLPLSISYRCPAAVIKHAKKIVPDIEPRPDAPEGEVITEGSIKNVKDGDVILCRTNFPIVQLCLDFIKQGRKAIVRGNDMGKALSSFLKPYEGLGVDEMMEGIDNKRQAMVKKLIKKYPDRDITQRHEYQSMHEKIQIINILAEDCNVTDQVLNKIARIFSDDMGVGITLSTVHRFKGLEADNVFIVEPQLIPFPFNVDQPWQKVQERNIDYVARTRAIKKLEYIRDWTVYKKSISTKKKPSDLIKELAESIKHVDPELVIESKESS